MARAFEDELEKIASTQEKALSAAKKYLPSKRIATFGAGVGAALLGKQAFGDWSLGRRIRKQQSQ